MADEEVKINAFGKTYGKLGDEKTNLCLATAGDVKIKTANSYVTIFKNGKLNVDDTKVVYTVSSMEEAKKNALYIIGEDTSEDEESEETETSDEESSEAKESKKDVYLYIDGETILLASTTDAYISYGIEQALTAEQFLRALKNIGFYFATLEDAKKTSITDGLVYILEEGKMYKVVGGEYTDYLATEEEEPTTEEEPEEIKTLTVGDIFLDGENKIINARSSFKIEVNGVDYMEFSGNKITFMKDVVLYDGFSLHSTFASQGNYGFMIYEDEDGICLETDSLVVHNGIDEYTPSVEAVDIIGGTENIILSAENGDSGVKLTLKYAENFSVGDKVAVWTASNNELDIDIQPVEDDEEEATGNYKMTASADSISTPTTVTVTVAYYMPGDSSDDDEVGGTDETISVEVKMEMYYPDETGDDDDDYDDDTEPYAYGETYFMLPDEAGDDYEIVSVSISGDPTLYYGEGIHASSPMFAMVVSENPMILSFESDMSDSDIEGLKNSKIVLVNTENKEEKVIYREGAKIEIREYDNELNYISYTTIGETENGEGIFTENLTVPSAWCGTIIFSKEEYATYDPNSVDVRPSIEEIEQLGDEVIPSLGMIRALIDVIMQ